MKRLLIAVLASLALAPLAGMGAAGSFTNFYGILLSNPQIDATNVINYGSISASTTVPFVMYDVLNFTNTGTMSGSPGFRFETVAPGQNDPSRRMMNNFVNLNAGTITASSSGVDTIPCRLSVLGPSYLLVWASNIVSRGASPASLQVGAGGWLSLVGNRIDLTRSGLEVLPIWAEALGDSVTGNPPTNFTPDIAVYDTEAFQGNFTQQNPLSSSALWGPPASSQPPPQNGTAFSLLFPVADSYIAARPNSTATITITNFTGPATNVTATNILVTVSFSTNIVKQAVFAEAPGGFSTTVGFSGAGVVRTTGALVGTTIPNAVTDLPDAAYVTVQDSLAASGPQGVISNLVGCPLPGSGRPANYLMSRLNTSPGAAGGNGYPASDFFIRVGLSDTNIASDAVTNASVASGAHSDYGAFFDNVVSRPPAIPAGTVSNMPGRITIEAQDLDMTRARLQANGLIDIKVSNLISSSNAVVDAENLSLDLSSSSGTVNVKNLAKEFINRLQGQVYVWSAFWTNIARVLITNNYVFSNIVIMDGTNIVGTNIQAFSAPLTNFVQITFHTTMFDATALATSVPVYVHDLVIRTPNAVITDPMTVPQSFRVEGQSLTLQTNLTFPGSLPPNPVTGVSPPGTAILDWTAALAPNLLYFTNHGYLWIYNEGHFGDDRPTPYSAFVNTGTVDVASLQIRSSYVENSGTLLSVGPVFVEGGTTKLENGAITAGGVIDIRGGSLKLNHAQLTGGNYMSLTVTNSLSDAGPGSGSTLTAPYGFNLPIKPQSGDLLGTTLQCIAPRFYSVTHTWAGEDRGATTAGYTNNVAVGTFQLRYGDNFGQHFFQGTGVSNGLYTDLLDLSTVTSEAGLLDQLATDPGMVVYFAAARLGFIPPPNADGIPQQPEEYLDGQFGGHLRWVQSYAGANSSVTVLINGQSVLVNKALRNSKIIDSNGNGLPNYYDPNPFNTPMPALVLSLAPTNPPPAKVLALTWLAAPNTVYQVEFTTDAALVNWQPLAKYTNNAPTNRIVTVFDTNAPAGAVRRFYRVGFIP